jgi:hypothetical protein
LDNSIKIFKNIEFEIDKERLIKRLFINDDTKEEFLDMLNSAIKTAKPKAMFTQVKIDDRGEDYVTAEGIKFCSRILRINLEDVYKIHPYIVTAGLELEKWSERFEEVLRKYWADSIKEEILENAVDAVLNNLDEYYNLDKASDMNPGSLKDWPISEQKKLFKLFDNPEAKIGVKLSDSMLMYPTKSVTGIRFPTEIHFENCQLCRRENCPGRRTAYDPELYEKRYLINK